MCTDNRFAKGDIAVEALVSQLLFPTEILLSAIHDLVGEEA